MAAHKRAVSTHLRKHIAAPAAWVIGVLYACLLLYYVVSAALDSAYLAARYREEQHVFDALEELLLKGRPDQQEKRERDAAPEMWRGPSESPARSPA